MKKSLLFTLLILPLWAVAQPQYNVFAYETHPLRTRGATMIRQYAKEFIEKENHILTRKCDNTEVPERYRKGKVYEDEKGVYMDAVIFNYRNKAGYEGMVTYGTWAFLVKDMRSRIELRDVKFIGGDSENCPNDGYLRVYINCLVDKDLGETGRIQLHHTSKLYSVSAVYKDYLAETNGRKDDETNIGDDW